jgi:hypothetical protein
MTIIRKKVGSGIAVSPPISEHSFSSNPHNIAEPSYVLEFDEPPRYSESCQREHGLDESLSIYSCSEAEKSHHSNQPSSDVRIEEYYTHTCPFFPEEPAIWFWPQGNRYLSEQAVQALMQTDNLRETPIQS